jgi:hypothetical protein
LHILPLTIRLIILLTVVMVPVRKEVNIKRRTTLLLRFYWNIWDKNDDLKKEVFSLSWSWACLWIQFDFVLSWVLSNSCRTTTLLANDDLLDFICSWYCSLEINVSSVQSSHFG